MHILIDTELIDPLFVRYAFQRHEAILRLSNKEDRTNNRDTIYEIYNNKSDRPTSEHTFYTLFYETGYSKKGLRLGK